MAEDDRFNLDLLIKMMKMTTADNDGTALVAIRKANQVVAKAGGDWESILRSKVKVTILADPFANIQMPTAPATTRPTMSTPKSPPTPNWRPTPQPPPRQTPYTPPPTNYSTIPSPRPNKFSGPCILCNATVGVGAGEAFMNTWGHWKVRHLPGMCVTKTKPTPRNATISSPDDLLA